MHDLETVGVMRSELPDYASTSMFDMKKRGKSAASFYHNLKGSSARNNLMNNKSGQ